MSSSLTSVLARMERKIEKILEIVEGGKRLYGKPQDWWKWNNIKEMGGYPGISMLMALWHHGNFDRVTQWSKLSGVPRSTLFLIRKELKKLDLIRGKMELTGWGERVCKILDMAEVPIVSKGKLLETVENLKRKVRS